MPGSLRRFTESAWHLIEPGTVFIPNWHIDAICEHLEAAVAGQIRNLLITMPPRHMKSIGASVTLQPWLWIKRASLRFLYSSYALNLSIRDALKSRRIIQSQWYQDRWAAKFRMTSDQNAKVRFENDKTGFRVATSVDGMGTGEGGDFVIVDDPHNVKEGESEVQRQNVLDWWDGTMSTRLNDPKTGIKIIIMQRVHEHDLAAHVLEQGGYVHLNLPAEYEGKKNRTSIGWEDPRKKKGELMWPARFGKPELDEIKLRLGPYRASGQLQQHPTPVEGGILKRTYFRLWAPDKRLPIFHFILQSYDTAFTDKTVNDPSACTTWGLFKIKGLWNIMLLDNWRDHLTYPILRKRVKLDRKAEYGEGEDMRKPDLILIENKGSGITLIQDLGLAGIAAWPYNPNKADKMVRAIATTPFGAAGHIWLLESNKRRGEPIADQQPFLDECLKFGPTSDKDDYVDTFSQAVQYFRDHGMLEAKIATGEDDIEQTDYHNEGRKPNPYGQ